MQTLVEIIIMSAPSGLGIGSDVLVLENVMRVHCVGR